MLERRELMAVSGHDYQLNGSSWANPSHITYSIPADGTFWDHGINNLNATFDAKFGAGVWQRELARALATWQSVANINLVPVSDNNEEFNTIGLAQGDPRFGDIRIGGYIYNTSTTILAQTYFPPPNGSTAAGDFEANTSINFQIGSEYDLYSVFLHEMGHALGLEHVDNPEEVMYPRYHGVRTGLSDGDIAGIQAIYGPRTADTYRAGGRGLGNSTAIDLSSSLAGNSNVTITDVSLPNPGSSEYYSFVIPSYASKSLQIIASAGNISMLSPKLSLYDSSGHLVDEASDPSAWSNNVTVTASNIVPGQQYYVVVSGATGDYFDAGAYQLQVSLPGSTPPNSGGSNSGGSSSGNNQQGGNRNTVLQPISVTPPPPSPDRYEPSNSFAQAVFLGRTTQVTLDNLTFNTSTDQDYFRFKSAGAGSYRIIASGATIKLYDARGRLIASGADQIAFNSPKRVGNYYVQVSSSTHSLVHDYDLTISYSRASKFTRIGRVARRLVEPGVAESSRPANARHGLTATKPQSSHPNRPVTHKGTGLNRLVVRTYPKFLARSAKTARKPMTWVADLGG